MSVKEFTSTYKQVGDLPRESYFVKSDVRDVSESYFEVVLIPTGPHAGARPVNGQW